MTAFVILAGGRGSRVSRVGAGLHKALLPLDNRAVLTHLFQLAPPAARLIVSLGYNGQQIRDYCASAHPGLDVTFVETEGWDMPGAGPGTGLLAARDAVGDDTLVFTSCDTLWESDPVGGLWLFDESWVGVAPVPPGTDRLRWCRVAVHGDDVRGFLDKMPGDADLAYVGLARIARRDLDEFWDGVVKGPNRAGERQVSGGFDWLLTFGDGLKIRHLSWIDVGDERAYRDAVARVSGYDWTKTGEATYLLPEVGRVVKYIMDETAVENRVTRAVSLNLTGAVPARVQRRGSFMSYDYVHGRPVYDALDRLGPSTRRDMVDDLLGWREESLTNRDVRGYTTRGCRSAAMTFYYAKTMRRIHTLTGYLRDVAYDEVSRIDWDALVDGVIPGIFHGDLNFGNVVTTMTRPRAPGQKFIGIDWRGDFGGGTGWGDLRYDVAKLAGGCVVHWGNARRGDFRPWHLGYDLQEQVLRHVDENPDTCGTRHDVEIIGALSLINSAPLHASPLDEILVARGCAWLAEVL